jgi:hypothetical protein
MSVKTIRETDNYSYDIDTLYGTGWFVRKSDDMVTLLFTGSEAYVKELAYVGKLLSDNEFDLIAKQQTYNNRWSEDS